MDTTTDVIESAKNWQRKQATNQFIESKLSISEIMDDVD